MDKVLCDIWRQTKVQVDIQLKDLVPGEVSTMVSWRVEAKVDAQVWGELWLISLALRTLIGDTL